MSLSRTAVERAGEHHPGGEDELVVARVAQQGGRHGRGVRVVELERVVAREAVDRQVRLEPQVEPRVAAATLTRYSDAVTRPVVLGLDSSVMLSGPVVVVRLTVPPAGMSSSSSTWADSPAMAIVCVPFELVRVSVLWPGLVPRT